MNFKDIKQGYSIYVLNKNLLTISTEKVKSISLPHVDVKFANTSMVVDVTTDAATYCMVADTDIAYPENKVITTDKVNILREVESLRTISEQALGQIDRHKEIIEKANALIADLDPTQKEKQVNEARFNSIEANIQKMMTMLTKMQQK